MDELQVFAEAMYISDKAERDRFLDERCSDQACRHRLDQLLEAHFSAAKSPGIPWENATSPIAGPSDFQDPRTPFVGAATIEKGMVISDRYTLLERIGSGGMGEVWVADQREPVRRKVAIKLIKAGMDSRAVLARFDAERQALAFMDHPNVAKVLDGGVTSLGKPYFVMELVKGVPITDYCDQCQFNVNERLRLFTQICHAVQHAHHKGIIHRDIKPSNILVTEYEGTPTVKVIDFGLAKAVHGGHALTDISLQTAFGAVVGTPLYMAPEQLRVSALDVDTRVDLYSLGVVLYELLTGSTPIEKHRMAEIALEEILRIVREEEPPVPSQRLSSSDGLANIAARRHVEPMQLTKMVKGDLDWIIMKAIDKDRNRRYDSANSLAMDIDRYLDGEAISAAPPSRMYRLRKLLRKRRGPIAAGALSVLLLIGGIMGTSIGLYQARKRAEAERMAKIVAEEERIEAEAARKEADFMRLRAEEREGIAIESFRSFGDSIAKNPQLKNDPSLESLRLNLLAQPLSFFESLQRRLQSDTNTRPESLAKLASVSYELGVLTDEIGKKKNALIAYEQSLETSQKLVNDFPDNLDYRLMLAKCQHSLGVGLRNNGRLDESFQALEKAKKQWSQLVELQPSNEKNVCGLAICIGDLGILYHVTGKHADALQAYRDSSSGFQQLIAASPTTMEYRKRLAFSMNNQGLLLRDQGQSAEALTAFEKARGIHQQLVSEDEEAMEARCNLASSIRNIATLYRDRGELTKAKDEYLKSVEIAGALVEEAPSVSRYQSDYAWSLSNLGDLLRLENRYAEAVELYQRVIDIRRRLVAKNPSAIEFQSGLAVAHGSLAIVYAEQDNHSESLVEFEKARENLEALANSNTGVTRFQTDLARCHNNIGEVLRKQGKLEEAMASLQRSCEIQRRLVESGSPEPEIVHSLAMTLVVMSEIAREKSNQGLACTYLRQSLRLIERAAQLSPSNAEYHRELEKLQQEIKQCEPSSASD